MNPINKQIGFRVNRGGKTRVFRKLFLLVETLGFRENPFLGRNFRVGTIIIGFTL